MKKRLVVLGLAVGLVFVAPVAVGAFEFLKLGATGAGDVDATLTIPSQSGLSGVLIQVANTGSIPSGAYYRVTLDSVDGQAYDAELYRADDDGLLSHLWVLPEPLGMKPGDKLVVTYPNTGQLTGGTWCVQGFFSAD